METLTETVKVQLPDGSEREAEGDPSAKPATVGEPDGGHPYGASEPKEEEPETEAEETSEGGQALIGGQPAEDVLPEEPSAEESSSEVPPAEALSSEEHSPDPSDSESQAVPTLPTAEVLLGEIKQLRERLDKAERERSRIAEEITEFRTLYPDVSPDTLPASVWDAFAQGVPLAASFALAERYRIRAEELAKATDERNRAEASPSVGGTAPTGFYSPDEVRAMSAHDVRTHYEAILDSMKHWDR